METVQQNGRFTLFSSKFLSIYSILYEYNIYYFLQMKRMCSKLILETQNWEYELSLNLFLDLSVCPLSVLMFTNQR